MTFLATEATLADAKATAVSAMISAWPEPKPPVTDRLIKESSTMSINSDTCQRQKRLGESCPSKETSGKYTRKPKACTSKAEEYAREVCIYNIKIS